MSVQAMSRTKHTVPRRIRAATRVRAPYEPRGFADQSSRHLLARALKESGIVLDSPPVSDRGKEPAPLPRLIVKRARSGYFHPAGKAEILQLLRFFGEECSYGIRTIELLQAGRGHPGGDVPFGTLLVPGRIVLYEQPFSPWLLPGRLSAEEQQKVCRAGAKVEWISESTQTIVSWPGDTLRDFMLFDVLMHEVGHHLLQHHKGKRRERVARTADHEASAARFAVRCRLLYRSGGEASQ